LIFGTQPAYSLRSNGQPEKGNQLDVFHLRWVEMRTPTACLVAKGTLAVQQMKIGF
jgi:hypothetical protein